MRLILAPIALASLALAGCGGGDGGGGEGDRLTKAGYEQAIQGLDRKLSAQSTEFGTLVGELAREPAKADLKRVETETADFQEAARGAVDEYAKINPPEEVNDLHDRLTTGTGEFVDDLDELRETAADGDRDAAAAEANKLQTGEFDSIKELSKVTQEFIAKGYDLKS